MVVLRATQKLLKSLAESAGDGDVSDTALGDWYANRIVVDRKPLLLLISSKSLLTVLTPARNVRSLPSRLSMLVADRLSRLGVDESLITSEVNAMAVTQVGRTRDRSVTGQLVYFAKSLPYYLPIEFSDDSTLQFAEDRFSETPCRCARPDAEVIFPAAMTKQLLSERWGGRG